jgi:hypothetical protein
MALIDFPNLLNKNICYGVDNRQENGRILRSVAGPLIGPL